MQIRPLPAKVLLPLLLIVSPAASFGADVLQNVPSDALGFVVINNLAATDSKVQRLLTTMQAEFPGPLAFLQAATGVSEGLDPRGDLLFVVFPGGDPRTAAPQFGVWLPVRNYDRLRAALHGTAGQSITAVTVAGEDLLIAHHGAWALVMDPDQRERMERMLSADPNPPAAVAKWQRWIDDNDVDAVALPGGIRAILAWAAATQPELRRQPDAVKDFEDDVFGYEEASVDSDPFAAAPRDNVPSYDANATVRAAIRKWTNQSPKLSESLLHVEAIGLALQLDENGNALAGLRVNCSHQRTFAANEADAEKQLPPPTLYQGGSFVIHGAGALPPDHATAIAAFFVRSLVDDLRTEEGIVLNDATVVRFQQAVEQATADVVSVTVLTQPGDKQEGVYTNDFVAVRVNSADAFVGHANEVMQLWNAMNREAKGETSLMIDVEKIQVGERAATQYSLDIAAAEGAPAIPEIRQAMEKLFGPGGKLRIWIVPIDDETVLLAIATPEQVAAALEVHDRKQPIDWSRSELAPANQLLPERADWRLYFSPHAYNNWRRRQMEAITGPVFGGPLVKDFPASPPVGVAGGFRDDELWIDAAMPADTIQAASAFLKK